MYSSAELVANAARTIEIKTGRAATMTPADANDFLRWADSIIDSRLSAVYFTPLRQVVRNGETKYPDPIEMIATNLAAGYMIESVFQRIEPVVSDAGKVHKDNALIELDDLAGKGLVGSYALAGQTRKARNSFVNPNAAPLDPPKDRSY